MVDSSSWRLDPSVWPSESGAACCCAPVHGVSCVRVPPLSVTAPIPAVHVPGTSCGDSAQGRRARMQGQGTMDDSPVPELDRYRLAFDTKKSKTGCDFQWLLPKGLLSRCSGHRQSCLNRMAHSSPPTTQDQIMGVELWGLTQGVAIRAKIAASRMKSRTRSRRCIVASMSTIPTSFRAI